MFSKVAVAFVAAAMAFVSVNAESHTVSFTNNCGYGTPTLIGQDGSTLSTGGSWTSNGAANGLIAFLQTGGCGANGESCTLVEATLSNGYSSADISLISPHAFSVTSGFGYYNGCDGAGADCNNADCSDAFHSSDQTWVQVGCSAADVDLSITFCD
ncbi:hypothetical protein AcW1_000561 [Taiwanofungus camphoratus]|nr:hypothetical protein AcW2_000947 [Antrodia cinnamomea]KAI0936280.1 hypothetical protein AcV5_004458 [Antrodia cinnamomea]KAI0961490.1 hypothetical protein AcV7_000578 [Antrodia cinnamomea]KAI0963501.1 hypothetical protein AcW1_000561 [Antrodia cinnamomea]